MSDIAIRAENLSKRYRLGQREPYKTLRDVMTDAFTAPFRRWRKQNFPISQSAFGNPKSEYIWALKDVSFEVKQGEVVGVIGGNGAGKSTLLKVLSRTAEPTEGYAEIYGRVGSLLEVGTGFSPELTGRENIYLNAAILGMKRREIDRKFDEIVAFAEIEKFLDTPVKHYSSGMYIRLAFAVAAHLEPEILLVDEVLAVGDAAFQKKCLGKMGGVAKEGRTVLFVSHNMLAIRGLTKRCLLLNEGRIECEGDVAMVVERYLAQGAGGTLNEVDASKMDRPEGLGTIFKITRVHLYTSDGQARIMTGAPLIVEMDMEIEQQVEDVVYGYAVFSLDGIRLFQCHNVNEGPPYPHLVPGRYRVRAVVDHLPLPPGSYRLGIGARCRNKGLDWIEDLMLFDVEELRILESPWFRVADGLVRLPSRWEAPVLLP